MSDQFKPVPISSLKVGDVFCQRLGAPLHEVRKVYKRSVSGVALGCRYNLRWKEEQSSLPVFLKEVSQ